MKNWPGHAPARLSGWGLAQAHTFGVRTGITGERNTFLGNPLSPPLVLLSVRFRGAVPDLGDVLGMGVAFRGLAV